MPDLLEKYFGKDLTEAEEEALGGALLAEDDTAEKLAAEAEAAYVRYGLPEPRWTGGNKPPFLSAGGGKIWAWVMLLIGAAVLALWGRPALVSLKGALVGERSVPGPSVKGKGALGTQEKRGGSSREGDRSDLRSQRQGSGSEVGGQEADTVNGPGMGEAGDGVDRSRIAPMSEPRVPPRKVGDEMGTFGPSVTGPAPVPWKEEAQRAYSNLSVVVDQGGLGYVTVRVLDGKGVARVLLYQGNLEVGRWVFEWDGKLPDHHPAPYGYYQIEVRSGSQTLRKSIQLKP
jgi:hypothetical protein